MASKKIPMKASPKVVKKDVAKPKILNQVTVKAKAVPKQDSIKIGSGLGSKTFAKTDLKKAVKTGHLKGDTTHHRAMSRSFAGNNDKADYTDLQVKKSKLGKK